jgi:hypothetical protein
VSWNIIIVWDSEKASTDFALWIKGKITPMDWLAFSAYYTKWYDLMLNTSADTLNESTVYNMYNNMWTTFLNRLELKESTSFWWAIDLINPNWNWASYYYKKTTWFNWDKTEHWASVKYNDITASASKETIQHYVEKEYSLISAAVSYKATDKTTLYASYKDIDPKWYNLNGGVVYKVDDSLSINGNIFKNVNYNTDWQRIDNTGLRLWVTYQTDNKMDEQARIDRLRMN